MRRVLLLIAMAALAPAAVQAQIQITGLDQLAAKAKESVDITLDPAMLQMAARFLGSANSGSKGKARIRPGLYSRTLKAIQVKSFEFAAESQYRQRPGPNPQATSRPRLVHMLSTKRSMKRPKSFPRMTAARLPVLRFWLPSRRN